MSDTSLRDLIAEALGEAKRFQTELSGESSRAAAILAAAHLEDALCDAIEAKFIPLNRDLHDKIFTGYGPISTFSAKIDIGLALGLYNSAKRNLLISVKGVRNRFAHAAKPIDFTHPDIIELCRQFPVTTNMPADTPRERYVAFCLDFASDLLGAAYDQLVRATPPSKA